MQTNNQKGSNLGLPGFANDKGALPEYYSKTELLKRGWTQELISQLLGDPDKQEPNPYYRSAAPMRLFLKPRVLEAEAGVIFQEYLPRYKRRSVSARKAAETKRNKTLEEAKAFDIEIPDLSPNELAQGAVNHYNNHRLERYDGYDDNDNWLDVSQLKPWSVPHPFRDRICVNFLRHDCTNYDLELKRLSKRVGKAQARQVIFERIIELIAGKYPYLAEEAHRQYRKRELDGF